MARGSTRHAEPKKRLKIAPVLFCLPKFLSAQEPAVKPLFILSLCSLAVSDL